MTNDVFVNSLNWISYFLYKQFGRIRLFNFQSIFELINSYLLIASCISLFELRKEKRGVDKLAWTERVNDKLKTETSEHSRPITKIQVIGPAEGYIKDWVNFMPLGAGERFDLKK